MRKLRIIFMPQKTSYDILKATYYELAKIIPLMLESIKHHQLALYIQTARELSSILPYPITHKLDKKFGFELAWKAFTDPKNLEARIQLCKIMESIKPSDFQSIIEELVTYFNQPAIPVIDKHIKEYLEGKIDINELQLRIANTLGVGLYI